MDQKTDRLLTGKYHNERHLGLVTCLRTSQLQFQNYRRFMFSKKIAKANSKQWRFEVISHSVKKIKK